MVAAGLAGFLQCLRCSRSDRVATCWLGASPGSQAERVRGRLPLRGSATRTAPTAALILAGRDAFIEYNGGVEAYWRSLIPHTEGLAGDPVQHAPWLLNRLVTPAHRELYVRLLRRLLEGAGAGDALADAASGWGGAGGVVIRHSARMEEGSTDWRENWSPDQGQDSPDCGYICLRSVLH
jgi:hypothetical protein